MGPIEDIPRKQAQTNMKQKKGPAITPALFQ